MNLVIGVFEYHSLPFIGDTHKLTRIITIYKDLYNNEPHPLSLPDFLSRQFNVLIARLSPFGAPLIPKESLKSKCKPLRPEASGNLIMGSVSPSMNQMGTDRSLGPPMGSFDPGCVEAELGLQKGLIYAWKFPSNKRSRFIGLNNEPRF